MRNLLIQISNKRVLFSYLTSCSTHILDMGWNSWGLFFWLYCVCALSIVQHLNIDKNVGTANSTAGSKQRTNIKDEEEAIECEKTEGDFHSIWRPNYGLHCHHEMRPRLLASCYYYKPNQCWLANNTPIDRQTDQPNRRAIDWIQSNVVLQGAPVASRFDDIRLLVFVLLLLFLVDNWVCCNVMRLRRMLLC